MSIDGNSSVPIQSYKSPCQRPRNRRDVDESRICVVTEVERGEVEEVDDQHNLGPNIMSTHEQHDPGESQEVVNDEVTTNTCSSIDIVSVARKQVPDISDLRNEENDEVDVDNDRVQGEWSEVDFVDSPNGVAVVFDIVMGMMEGVVDTADHNQQPSDDCQELVGPYDLSRVALTLCERVWKSCHLGDCGLGVGRSRKKLQRCPQILCGG